MEFSYKRVNLIVEQEISLGLANNSLRLLLTKGGSK